MPDLFFDAYLFNAYFLILLKNQALVIGRKSNKLDFSILEPLGFCKNYEIKHANREIYMNII